MFFFFFVFTHILNCVTLRQNLELFLHNVDNWGPRLESSSAPFWHYKHQTWAVVMTAIHWGLTFWGFTKNSFLHRLVVSHGTGKSVQIIYVTEILQSLWFENLNSTYQKGNLHSDPVNPLPALLAFFQVLEFLMARFCCYRRDGQDVFLLSYCRVGSCSASRKSPYWNATDKKIAIFEVKALSSGTREPNGMERLYRVLDWGV